MGDIDFSKISILIVDDFGSFRKVIASLLHRLGVQKVEEACKPSEMLQCCQKHTFDVILCDYNLGMKRSGQNLLEELHYRGLMPPKTLFVMVTAESSKDLVLSAYDCKPADYLIKPINFQILQTRLERLLSGRNALLEAQELILGGLEEQAIVLLQQLIEKGGRCTSAAQKLLGEVYLRLAMWTEAKALFAGVAAERYFDWAELGLAKVECVKDDTEAAQTRLLNLLAHSPYYLPGHDMLIELYGSRNDDKALFDHLKNVAKLCPSAIARQRALARAAEQRGETLVQLRASYAAAKLGETSCYRQFDDVRSFVAAAGDVRESRQDRDVSDLLKESGRLLQQSQQLYMLDEDQQALGEFLGARTLYLAGDNEAAQRLYSDAQRHFEQLRHRKIHIDLAKYQCMVSAGQTELADRFLMSLVSDYSQDSAALQMLDKYLSEPISNENKSRIIEINREGIHLYQEERYDNAVECFSEAVKAFPRHAGLHLNYLQSLIGKLRKIPKDEDTTAALEDLIQVTKALVPHGDKAKQDRFIQLIARAKKLFDGP